MGKGTDKLYITHSEWASADAFSASKGAAGRAGVASLPGNGAPTFRRLPFNYCAASLQPFVHPVCTPDGTIFDAEVIGAWLDKQDAGSTTNPVTGAPLRAADLIRLNFARNDADGSGDLIDPVTFKVFTDNTHIVALRHGSYANVFAWDTVERMNIRPKMWRDLVDDEPFSRKDIITLQDPQNMAGRDTSQFQFVREGAAAAPGAATQTPDKVQRAKAAVEKARRARTAAGADVNQASSLARTGAAGSSSAATTAAKSTTGAGLPASAKAPAYNAATYTTGRAAASFTSTGLTPETSGARAVLSDEEWMLRPRRVKIKGYARIDTSLGALRVELHTDTAPRAVWNFVRLAQQGYYRGVVFHRNMPRFMIQGGDPTGTGRGGQSVWGKPFADELDGPHTHSGRGVVSMANKGRDSNGSQFFVTYRAAKHLDRKHTVFGQVVDGLDVLDRMEAAPVHGDAAEPARKDRPVDDIVIHDVVVLVDPFAEFLAEKQKQDAAEQKQAAVQRQGGTDDDKITWTGKRIRGRDDTAAGRGSSDGVGKYLKQALAQQSHGQAEAGGDGDTTAAAAASWEEPAKKKIKSGGFGSFDNW